MEENIICNNCKQTISTFDNFCPVCGEAISELARKFEIEKTKNIQLKTINKIIDKVEDEKTLKVLSEFINFLENK